ncbi:hypothetical protein [Streptomyces sp. NPDC088184]|uniref:hypothetical protein n=1 Tax=Streptomyces sp. NPDC088184 TaxID=3160991 RepID=UPI00343C0C21
MTRTAHYLRPSRTRKSYDDGPGAPWRSVILIDLRYSARSLTEAAAEARRPWPQRIRRRVSVHRFPRHNRDRGITRAATHHRGRGGRGEGPAREREAGR